MKKKEELITVIIPTYGRPKYLLRAIKSVLNQTYTNLEIIIVDDNGRNTKNQIETEEKILSLNNDKINYIIHNTNMNGSVARNTGIEFAKGNFICFLDDDDEFLNTKLEQQYNKLSNKSEKWIACYTGHIRVFDSKSDSMVSYSPVLEGEILFDILAFNIDHVSGSSLMVRTEVVKSIGGWNENLKRHQDYEFIARLSNQGNIAVISEPIVKIHVHEGSNRHKNFDELEETRIQYLNLIIPYLNKLNNKEIKQIKYINNYWLLKKAIQHKRIHKVAQYFIKTGKPLVTTINIFKDIYNYLRY